MPRAREKQRKASVLPEEYDSKQAHTYMPRTSTVTRRCLFESNHLEEKEASGRRRKKKRTSYREYEEDA